MSERLPLHVLPTFVIAARLENLRATAQQVHLTHGAVSQQIQLLEQAVGYPLFERRGRGVRLNAAGKEMLAAVEPALQALQQGVARARRAAAKPDAAYQRATVFCPLLAVAAPAGLP